MYLVKSETLKLVGYEREEVYTVKTEKKEGDKEVRKLNNPE
ncbi:hypothetical protein [Lederbergia lenta]|nr:hypothetical protein [Lederbergia lenta]